MAAIINIPVEGTDKPEPEVEVHVKDCSRNPSNQLILDDQKIYRMLMELHAQDLDRIALLTERLGIRCKDDVIRYCLAQVTWWVLSGPMAGASVPSSSHTGSSSSSDHKYGYQ